MDSEEDSDYGGYDSSDDEDYIPDDFSGDDEVEEKPKARKVKSPPKRSSTRRRGTRFAREDESEESEDEEEDEDEVDEPEYEDENEEEDKKEDDIDGEEKQRIDNIWESMKTDASTKKDSSKKEVVKKLMENNEKHEDDNACKESHDTKDDCKSQTPGDSRLGLAVESKNDNATPSKVSIEASGSKKRSGGLNSVLGTIEKKQKLSTLEQSKQDWESFKKDQGIQDDLRTNAKDGYLAKQEFLQRVDVRKWENERELRLATGRGKK
eukprot:gene19110-21027_t